MTPRRDHRPPVSSALLLLLLVPVVLLMHEVEATTRSVVHGAGHPLWIRRHRADPTSDVSLKLILRTQQSPAALEALVQRVSDVASPAYGQFLAPEALAAHWRPHDDARVALEAFLTAHAERITASTITDAVTMRMNVATAEKLFHTRLFAFQHREVPRLQVLRPHRDFVIPASIAPHVIFIDGLEAFPTPAQAQLMMAPALDRHEDQDGDPFAIKSQTIESLTSSVLVTPRLIRAQYEIPDDPAHVNASDPRNKLIIAAFLNEFYAERDLAGFLEQHETPGVAKRLRFPTHSGKCLAADNDHGHHEATGEASLDIQVAVSLTRSDDIEMLCFQDLRDPTRSLADDNQEPFLAFMETVNAMDPPPSVVSVSYTDEECAMPRGYMLAVNREFMKAALKGISIVISAGDAGVQGSRMADFCKIAPCKEFVPMFPASSPYVTSVGATTIDATGGISADDGKYRERVTSAAHGDLITSGGGFSRVFEQPAYQRGAVASYLEFAEAEGYAGRFNGRGRAYPDVAALGHAFPVTQNGGTFPTDGTSVSAPIVASVISLLNKQRLARGQPVLGFLNPLLYQLQEHCPEVFTDIVDGNSACSSLEGQCCAEGHVARPGWDATSGVGTLRFGTLLRELDGCIAKIHGLRAEADEPARSFRPISLLQDSAGLWADPLSRHIEQLGAVITLVAMIALVGVLVSLRGQLFPGRRFLEGRSREPARVYLLSDTD